MSDYNDLPIPLKAAKVLIGFIPPFFTWYATKNLWLAISVYVAGTIIGYFISGKHTERVGRTLRRDESGKPLPEEMNRLAKQTLPVFLWAPPVSGAVCALIAIIFWARA